MPEKTPATADFSLLSSLPPPTSEIITDKIPHLPEKCQLRPTIPSGEKTIAVHGGVRIFDGTALRHVPSLICWKVYFLLLDHEIDLEDDLEYSK